MVLFCNVSVLREKNLGNSVAKEAAKAKSEGAYASILSQVHKRSSSDDRWWLVTKAVPREGGRVGDWRDKLTTSPSSYLCLVPRGGCLILGAVIQTKEFKYECER